MTDHDPPFPLPHSQATESATATAAAAISTDEAKQAAHPPDPKPRAQDAEAKHRSVQFVTTLAQRRQMAEWMMQEVDRCSTEKHIASKAVRQFPSLFPGNPKANLMRASRIWRQRAQLICPELAHPSAASHPTPLPSIATRVQKQALPGRGRKRASWSDALQRDLLREFQRLRCAGLNFSPKVVRAAAESMLRRSTSTEYSSAMVDPRSERPLLECLTSRWVRAFADRYHLPLDVRPATGNISESKRMQLELGEKLVAFHLGQLSRLFGTGHVREGDVETLCPVHFVINTTNGKTLGFGEGETPQYPEPLGGTRAVTVLIRVSGGCSAVIEPPFVILQDPEYRYPLLGGPERVTDVAYRTSPSGWMDRVVLTEFFRDRRAIEPLPNGRKRILLVEPATWHSYASHIAEPLMELNTELRYFPQHCTELIQPVEAFIRQAVKDSWARGWEQMKGTMQQASATDGTATGNLPDVSPQVFLELAAKAVQDVNALRDDSGISYPRKAMIMTGMALSTHARWEVEQLHPELATIVTKHRQHFEGRIVTVEAKADQPKTAEKTEPSMPPFGGSLLAVNPKADQAKADATLQQFQGQPCAPQADAPDSFAREDHVAQQHA